MTAEDKDNLTEAVANELDRVAEAFNIAEDGPRIRQEAADGATAETMIEANIMLEDQAYRSQLENLEAAGEADDRAASADETNERGI